MFLRKKRVLFSMLVIVMILLGLSTNAVYAAPIDRVPVTVTQPDGT